MTAILTATGVGKSYGSGAARMAIIDGLTLSIGAGEFVSLVGPSGCGKTTLLMCLSGLLAASEGTVAFKGAVIAEPPIAACRWCFKTTAGRFCRGRPTSTMCSSGCGG